MLPARLDSAEMPLPDDLALRDARTADLPAIAALRRSVEWPVHDWALRAVVEAPNARCVVVTDRPGATVAVGSGIAYGALGVVGNMIVAEAHRRRGVGAAVLEVIVDHLESVGCTRLELYATAAGRPLYGRHGFSLIDPGAMAHIPRSAVADCSPASVEPAGPDLLTNLAAYDRPRFGGDRSVLLAVMADDPDRPLLVARSGDAIIGYTWLRRDGGRVGPFVADAPSVAGDLLAAAFAHAPSATTLTTNLPMANEPGTAWLREAGVTLEPWDGRMARGADIPRRIETIYGNAVGALG